MRLQCAAVRSSIAFLLSIGLLMPSSAFAFNCTNIFGQDTNRFQLVEKRFSSSTTPTVLRITAVNASSSVEDPFLAPGCVDQKVYFNLNRGIEILDFSNELASSIASQVSVTSACDGAMLFKIDRDEKMLTLPSGAKVNTSVRVFGDSGETKLLAFVRVEEDHTNQLTLRGANGSILAMATKNLDTWTVTNEDSSEQTGTIISYLLALKRNTDFACPSLGISVPQIVIGALVGVVLVVAGVTALVCHLKRRPHKENEKLLEQLERF